MFKPGDTIQDKHGNVYVYQAEINSFCSITELVSNNFISRCTLYTPKFKVGDIIYYNGENYKVIDINSREYKTIHLNSNTQKTIPLINDIFCSLSQEQLKPFDKVLVRNYNHEEWAIEIFKKKVGNEYHCLMGSYRQCVLYEGNEKLLENETKNDM